MADVAVNPTPAISNYQPPSLSADMEAEMDGMLSGAETETTETETVTPVETPEGTEPVTEEETPETEETVEETQPVETEKTTEPTEPVAEALPDGVKLRKVDGALRWILDPDAGKAVFAKAQLVDEAEEIIGMPLTKEALEYHSAVARGTKGMKLDLVSPNADDQRGVVRYLRGTIDAARQNGEIGHDAMASFARVVLEEALTGDPKTARAVDEYVTRRAIDSLYEDALRHQDEKEGLYLWQAAQRADRNAFGTFRLEKDFTEGRTKTPSAKFGRALEERTQPKAETATQPANEGQYVQWRNETSQSIHKDAVLATVERLIEKDIPKAQRDKYPKSVANLRNQLIDAVREGFRADDQLQEQVATANTRAQRATTDRIRNELKAPLVQRHAATAERILQKSKGPILSEFAELMAAKSNEMTRKLEAGARAGQQGRPSGGPAVSRTANPPQNTGKFQTTGDWEKEFDAHAAS